MPIESGNTSIEMVMPASVPRRFCRAFAVLAVERIVANDELLPTALSFRLDLAFGSRGEPTVLEIVADDDVSVPDLDWTHLSGSPASFSVSASKCTTLRKPYPDIRQSCSVHHKTSTAFVLAWVSCCSIEAPPLLPSPCPR